jgi:TRAP-type transport system periplasmic protein
MEDQMKRILALAAALLMAASLNAAVKYEIKFASVAPDGSTWMNIIEELNEEIMDATNGEVKFKFYAGGISGDEKDVIRKMKINNINAAGFTSQGLGEIAPEVRILNLPLMFKSYKEVDYVMKKMSPAFEAAMLKKGFVALGWPEVGFVYVFSKKKIESIKEMQSAKMWIWGDDVFVNTLFKNLSVVPIPLSLIDVLQSLQTGLIDAVYTPPLSAIALQWNTKVTYMLDLKIATVPGVVVVNKSTWAKIPDNYKKIIKDKSAIAFKKLTDASRRENEEALAVLKKQGIKFTTIKDPADQKVFEEVSLKTANDLVGKFYSKKLLDEMLGYIKEANAGAKAK